MEFEPAAILTRELMTQFGLADWAFGWNRRKRSLGLCRYRERRIELSAYFVNANALEQVRRDHPPRNRRTPWPVKRPGTARCGRRCASASAASRCVATTARPSCPGGGGLPAAAPAARNTGGIAARPAGRRYWCRGCGPERGTVVFAPAAVAA